MDIQDFFGVENLTGIERAIPFLLILLVLVVRGRGLPLRSHITDRLPKLGTGRVSIPGLLIGSGILLFLLFSVMGLDDVYTDPSTAGFPQIEDDDVRLKTWERLIAGVRSKTEGEWQAIFEREHDLFAEEARGGPRVLEHPQLLHGDATVLIEDPERGTMRQPGAIVRFPGAPHT